MTDFLDAHVEALARFAESHISADVEESLIRLKMDHSLKVLDNARTIVREESLSASESRLCLLCALYHDIGRFPQIARYHTFNDRESINHGRAGVLALRGFTLPEGVSDSEARIIRFSVGQHNLKTVRDTLPAHLVHPVHVVRDADKLDIFRVMIAEARNGDRDPAITLGIESNDPDAYSDAIYESVLTGRDCEYTDLRHPNDFLLLLLGWTFGLRYAASLDLVLSRGHLKAIFSQLPDDARIRALEAKMNEFVRYKTGTPS